jgi:hypothetical protein
MSNASIRARSVSHNTANACKARIATLDRPSSVMTPRSFNTPKMLKFSGSNMTATTGVRYERLSMCVTARTVRTTADALQSTRDWS